MRSPKPERAQVRSACVVAIERRSAARRSRTTTAHATKRRRTFPHTHMECGSSSAQGLFTPLCGVGFGGGSASAVVDVCVATHMRGLVPHDRVCEMRSGAVFSGVERGRLGCSQCSLGSLLASLRRCALLAERLRAVLLHRR